MVFRSPRRGEAPRHAQCCVGQGGAPAPRPNEVRSKGPIVRSPLCSPRRAARSPTNLSQQCGSSPGCQPGVGGMRPLDTSLPTPMHNAYRLCPPRCTSPTASPHPDDPSLTASAHPDAPRPPPIPTPMHIAHRRSPPRRLPQTPPDHRIKHGSRPREHYRPLAVVRCAELC